MIDTYSPDDMGEHISEQFFWIKRTTPGGRTREVVKACAKWASVSFDEVVGQRRSKNIVVARHAAIWIIYMRMGRLSLPQIGRIFGGRDHSTIIHARNRVQADLDAGGEVFGAIIAHVELELGLR